MKFGKILIASALALTMGVSALAETPLDFGIKGGLNLNMMPWTTLDVGDRVEANVGFNAGVYSTLSVSDYMFLQAELFYTMKGVTTRSEIQGSYRRNIHYLELPLLVGVNMSGDDTWRIMTGPALAVCLGDKVTYESALPHASSLNSTPHSCVLDWVVEGNFAITDSLIAEIKFDLGLTRTFKPTSSEISVVDKGRNATVSFGLCYRFGY